MALTEREELELLELEEREQNSAPQVSAQASPSKLESFARGAAQAASFGFADEITGGLESLFTDKPYEQARDESRLAYKKASDANPASYLTGNVSGGVATALIPGLNLAKGASALKTVGQAALMGGASGLGASEAEDVKGLLKDASTGAAIGGAVGSVARGIPSVTKKVKNIISEAQPPASPQNIEALKKAAQDIGVELTPGMKSASYIERGLENSLSESPSPFGALVRRQQNRVYDKLREGADDVFQSSGKSKVQSGESIKEGFESAIRERGEPIGEIFEKLKKSTEFIDVPKNSKEAIARNIEKEKLVRLAPSEGFSTRAKALAENIRNLNTVDDVKTMRGIVGRALESSTDANERQVMGKIYDKLSKLEENTIKRAAIKQARTPGEGQKIGKEMLEELRLGKEQYRDFMQDLKELAKGARLGDIKTPGDFTRKLSDKSGEEIVDKFFNKNNARALENLNKKLPDVFGELKDAAIENIKQKSLVVPRGGGERVLDPKKAIKEAQKLGPEIQKLLFGSKNPKLEAIDRVLGSIPENIGPSGTPRGIKFDNIFTTSVLDAPRYMLYKSMPAINSKAGQATGKALELLPNPLAIGLPQATTKKKSARQRAIELMEAEGR